MKDQPNTLFYNTKILGAADNIDNGWCLTNGNHIQSLGSGEPLKSIDQQNTTLIDCHGSTLLPGFIDLHTHGAIGADFVFGTADEMRKISAFFANHGVTGFLASTYAASQ